MRRMKDTDFADMLREVVGGGCSPLDAEASIRAGDRYVEVRAALKDPLSGEEKGHIALTFRRIGYRQLYVLYRTLYAGKPNGAICPFRRWISENGLSGVLEEVTENL